MIMLWPQPRALKNVGPEGVALDVIKHATLSDWRPAVSLQNSSARAVAGDNLKKLPAEKSTQDLKFHHHPRKEAGFSVKSTMMH
ncbi:hypothetical protein HPG69_009433 [Diceros bicornis minor]|uniref:Uncharacterized protein n=1 Tax=Diceros bicornis minor TaxID=77932 RepID=A0A7J7F2Z9_DICBM|nr:hypothetical protein HPG69_009433 [Diceros bicornis minor]